MGVASRTCLANVSWDILDTWPNQRSWDLSIRRSGSTFRAFRNSQLRILQPLRVTPRTPCKNPISAACTCDGTLSVITQDSWPYRWGSEQRSIQNWQLCGAWKLPFCDHRAIKLTQSCVCFTAPSINLFVSLSLTGEYHPKVAYLNFPPAAVCLSWVEIYCKANEGNLRKDLRKI